MLKIIGLIISLHIIKPNHIISMGPWTMNRILTLTLVGLELVQYATGLVFLDAGISPASENTLLSEMATFFQTSSF